jgi:signal transduction histidine kinase
MKKRDDQEDPGAQPAYLDTPLARLSLEDGVGVLEMTLETVQPAEISAHMDFMLGISQQTGQVAMPVLLDLGALRWLGWDARICAAEMIRPEWNTKLAFLYRNPVQMVIAAFFEGMDRPEYPILITDNREVALEWLRSEGEAPVPEALDTGKKPSELRRILQDICWIGLAEMVPDYDPSGPQDELAAIRCGLALISEQLIGSFVERERSEELARKQRRRLELIISERTAELTETNERLRQEIVVHEKTDADLKRRNAELASFAHTVSHDLKGPLSVIQSASDTLSLIFDQSPKGDPAHEAELAQIIARNTGKAAALIEDVLTLAEAGQVPADVTDVYINELLDMIREEKASEIGEGNISFEITGDMGTIVASRTQMYQIFSNLVANMIQHNNSDIPVIRIESVEVEPPQHRYVISDNGSGIDDEDIAKVFEPFYKGKAGQTGIGLSTVGKLVGIYGGQISASNDNGARFEMTIADYEPPGEEPT